MADEEQQQQEQQQERQQPNKSEYKCTYDDLGYNTPPKRATIFSGLYQIIAGLEMFVFSAVVAEIPDEYWIGTVWCVLFSGGSFVVLGVIGSLLVVAVVKERTRLLPLGFAGLGTVLAANVARIGLILLFGKNELEFLLCVVFGSCHVGVAIWNFFMVFGYYKSCLQEEKNKAEPQQQQQQEQQEEQQEEEES